MRKLPFTSFFILIIIDDDDNSRRSRSREHFQRGDADFNRKRFQLVSVVVVSPLVVYAFSSSAYTQRNVERIEQEKTDIEIHKKLSREKKEKEKKKKKERKE